MKMAVFWLVTPCSPVEVYQCFRGPICLLILAALMMEVEVSGTSKTLINFYRLHSATILKTAIFIGLLVCAGIHPHDAKSWMEGNLEELREMARSPECVAVGECGLDYNRDFSPVNIQKEVFEKQV
jgi:TatD DNase family protein